MISEPSDICHINCKMLCTLICLVFTFWSILSLLLVRCIIIMVNCYCQTCWCFCCHTCFCFCIWYYNGSNWSLSPKLSFHFHFLLFRWSLWTFTLRRLRDSFRFLSTVSQPDSSLKGRSSYSNGSGSIYFGMNPDPSTMELIRNLLPLNGSWSGCDSMCVDMVWLKVCPMQPDDVQDN